MPLLILFADDDFAIRTAVGDCLELSGYTVITAEDGQQALNLLESYHPHLLISDIKMPQMDGYELVKRVRERPSFRLLPIILLTEKSNPEERIKGYQMGCDVYLGKPFLLDELLAIVRNLLDRSQMIQSEMYISDKEIKPEKSLPIDLGLSERETDVLVLLSQGLSNNEIGEHLHLSPRTVEKYVSNLFRKTETNKRTELIRFVIENHLC